MSGVVNIITRSGGDEHKLGVRLESDNWVTSDFNQQTDRMAEVEVTASGPIVRDRLYYFTANSLMATDTRWWQDFENSISSPIAQELSGFEKVDYFFSTTSKISVQGIYSVRSWRDYEFSWRFNLSGLPLRSRTTYRASLIYSNTISDRWFYTLSLNLFHSRSRIGEGDKNSITLNPYQYDSFLQYILSGKRDWWAYARQNIYTAKGELATRVADVHLVQFGIELNQYDLSSNLVKYEPQKTYFGKPLLDVPMLNYSNSYNYWPQSGSVYLQDKVEVVRDGWNVNLGLRWDFLDPTAERPIVEYIPVKPNEFQQTVTGTAKAKFKHQLSPRFSLATLVAPATFLFINFGQYFQFPLFDYLYSGITPSQLWNGTRNVLVGNPDLEPERSISWELGLKHELSQDLLGSITYFKKSFQNQIDSKTLVPFDSKNAGDYGFASYVNNDVATASGIELVLSKEHDERLSGSVSYSYMTTEGMSESANQAINYAQWGFPVYLRPYPLSWDQRHTLKADAEFKLPYLFEGDVIILYNSARPYSYYPTRDGFTPLDASKVFVPNNRRMADNLFVNLKLSRQFVLDPSGKNVLTIYIDARNVFNKLNVRWMDSAGKIGGELGDPSAYYDPRRIRVGVKLEM
jgi:outer membrane receptor for ferrienterochelin and colicin